VCICGGGGLRPLGGLHSLFGLWCGERFLLRIILCERGISWRVGVACVERMGKRWTIYSYIVLRLLVCRILFSGLLGWFGSYLGTFFLLGRIGLGDILLLSGTCSPLVCYGFFGPNAIDLSLRIVRALRANCLRILLLLGFSGLELGVSHLLLLLFALLKI
jgi:hypothetical protein